MTWAATDSPTIDFEFTSTQAKAHVIGAASEAIAAQSLSDLERYLSAVQVVGAPSGGDDTAMITAAIAALAARGGGILQFGTGMYRFDAVPVTSSNLWIRGTGWGTIFKRLDGGSGNHGMFNLDYILGPQVQNLRFSDFALDGNKSLAAHGRGLNIEFVKNIYFDHLYIHDCHEGGIVVGGKNDGPGNIGRIWITFNQVDDCGAPPNGWGGIAPTGGDDIIILGNNCRNDSHTSAYSIDCEPNSLWSMSRVLIANNPCKDGGIKCDAFGSLTDVMIIGNDIDARNAEGQGLGCGISGSCSGRVRILSSNIIAPSGTSAGINVGGGGGALDLVIGENTVVGIGADQAGHATQAGIYYYILPGGRGIIRNNDREAIIDTHATLPAGIVTWDQASLDRTKFSGNTFSPTILVQIGSHTDGGRAYQSNDIVTTANLPAVGAARVGLRLIEDAGANVYYQIDYIAPTRRTRTAYGAVMPNTGGNLSMGGAQSTVINDSTYNAFPGIALLPNGHLIMMYRTGATHVSNDGILKTKVSDDLGATWGSAVTALDPVDNATDGELTLLSDDTLICILSRSDGAGGGDSYSMIGTPTGDTVSWAAPVLVPNPFATFSNSSCAHPIELPGGRILAFVYGFLGGADTRYSIVCVYSDDSGATWSTLSTVVTNPTTYSYGEICPVLMPNGDIVAIVRRDEDGYSRIVSTDDGATWSAPSFVIDITGFTPGKPSLLLLPTGAMFLFTRIGANVIMGGWATSWDDGLTWTPFDAYGSKFMYASTVLLPSGVVASVSAYEVSSSDCNIVYQDFVT